MSEFKPQLTPLPEDWQCALAVVAHPDDMEYGAASAVARWTSQGKTIQYLLVTRGEAGIDSLPPDKTAAIRREEEIKSARVVGVESVEFLDYRDGMIEYGLPLRRDIARAIRRIQPEVLITLNHRLTWENHVLNMADHRHVGLASLDAARDAGNRWIFPELLKEGLVPWNKVRMVLLSGSPQPTHAVDVTGFMDQGIESLRQHHVYLDNLPREFNLEDFLLQNAWQTGKLLGCEHAVGFETVFV
jgi:LmbE family N-acetylglucosaminyl deacetylase